MAFKVKSKKYEKIDKTSFVFKDKKDANSFVENIEKKKGYRPTLYQTIHGEWAVLT